MFLNGDICGAQPSLQHSTIISPGLLGLGFRPIQEAGSCRSTFSAHSEKNVTMVTTKTTFHHHLWWTKMTTNASHCWHSIIAGLPAAPLIPITILLIPCLAGSSFIPTPLINLPSLRWILIPPIPQTIGHTVLRTRCGQDLQWLQRLDRPLLSL